MVQYWMRKAFAFIVLIALGSLYASGEEPQRPYVDVWSWNVAAASLKSLIPAFEEQHPNIDVNITMSGANMQSRFLLSLVAGVGVPDVSQLQLYETPRFTPSGRLMDLTDRAMKYKDSFSPAFWSNCLSDGKVYAIPWDMGPCAVFYKRHLFESYDVDIAAIETWDDYIEVGKRIVEVSGGKTSMLALSVNGLFDYFEMLIQQTGGGVFDAQGRIIINSQRNVEALEVLRKILESGIAVPVNISTHEYFASFQNDRIASYPHAVWMGGSIKDYSADTAGDWGVFRLPAVRPGGLRTSNIGGSVLVIPDKGENRDAAWTFVEYALCTREGQLAQYRDFDLFPCLMSVFDDPFFDEPDPFYGGQKVRRLFATDIDKIPTLVRTKDWAESRRYLTQSLSRWATNKEDHRVFLQRMERTLERKLGRVVAPTERP